MPTDLPANNLPIYGDDEDDDGITAKYLSGLDYVEILYSPIEVNLQLLAHIDNKHPHLFDDELQFVDFAIRKILIDDKFQVWDVEVESHHVYNVKVSERGHGLFQCDYQGLFSVGLQVNKYETDVMGLRASMKSSLLTSMSTGKFSRSLKDSFHIQRDSIIHRVGEKVEEFNLIDMNVYNDEVKIATVEFVEPPRLPHEHVYYDFLWLKNENDGRVVTVTEHTFTHAYVAMTVFALTLLCLIWSYGCFMSRACRRVRQENVNKKHKSKGINGTIISSGDDSDGDCESDSGVEIVNLQDQEPGGLERDLEEIVDSDREDANQQYNQQTDVIAF